MEIKVWIDKVKKNLKQKFYEKTLCVKEKDLIFSGYHKLEIWRKDGFQESEKKTGERTRPCQLAQHSNKPTRL